MIYETVSIGLVDESEMKILATFVNKEGLIASKPFKHLCRATYHMLKTALGEDSNLVMYAREDTPDTVFLEGEAQICLAG